MPTSACKLTQAAMCDPTDSSPAHKRITKTGGMDAEWAAKTGSAQGGLKLKLIGDPPKRPREASKIFSDEKLRLVMQSGNRPAWRANSIPRDVQEDFEGLPDDKKQGWETLAAGDLTPAPHRNPFPSSWASFLMMHAHKASWSLPDVLHLPAL